MNSNKKKIIIVATIIFGIFIFLVVMLIRSNSEKENKDLNDKGKKEIKRDVENEEVIKQLEAEFLSAESEIKTNPDLSKFSKQIDDIKTEDGIEIHNKYFLSPEVELKEKLSYKLGLEKKSTKGKRRHRIAFYYITKGKEDVGFKLILEIDKN